MTKISFVYIDVGGVVIQDFSDSDKWEIMMADMGVDKADRQTFNDVYRLYENEISCGKRHVDTLVPIYIQKFNLKLDPQFSMQNYFLDHFDPNTSLWPIVAKLKETAKVGLLTDQYPGLLDGIKKRSLLPPVVWDEVIDSTVVGLRKPEPAIYELAQNAAQVPPSEILFIDNREKNLGPARALGWQTFFYDSRDYAKASASLSAFLGFEL